jgi:hypothetical protein
MENHQRRCNQQEIAILDQQKLHFSQAKDTHYTMKGTTSEFMCAIFDNRCVPLVLFPLFLAFDVFLFILPM